MPLSDAERWNARYEQERYRSFERPRPFLVQHASLLPKSGLAIDIAMGLGGNAGYLLGRGLRVMGVDISETALRAARQRLPGLMAWVADLTQVILPAGKFDVLLNFFYLQRDLWPQYIQALRPGGILIIQSLTQDMLEYNPEIDPAFLLAPGELLHAFPGLEVLDYMEARQASETHHPRAVAGIVGMKK